VAAAVWHADDPSSTKLGAFLVQSQFQGSVHSSAMFLTAAAQNLLCLKLATELGVVMANPWLTWFQAAAVPAAFGLAVTPYLMYKVCLSTARQAQPDRELGLSAPRVPAFCPCCACALLGGGGVTRLLRSVCCGACLTAGTLGALKVLPPETKETPDAPKQAAEKLSKMGPMNRNESLMFGTMLLALAMWVSPDDAASARRGCPDDAHVSGVWVWLESR
jgi:di/tricarboxylate transporter